MALPLPKVVPDVGPGGAVTTAMGGMNALRRQMLDAEAQKIKNKYLPISSLAQAASQLAYSNAVGPQFLSKLANNPAFLANLPEKDRKMLAPYLYKSATTLPNANTLNEMMHHSGIGQPGTNNLSGFIKNAFRSLIGGDKTAPSNNVFSQNQMPSQNPIAPNQIPIQNNQSMDNVNPQDLYKQAATAWLQTPEAQAQIEKGVPAELPPANKLIPWFLSQNGQQNKPMELELTQGQKGNYGNTTSPERTFTDNVANYQGELAQGQESGKLRAGNIRDVGEELKQLSTTGANIDRLIDDFTQPDFIALREQFPYLQDTQLKVAAHTGSPEQRTMIGKLIADLESFKGSTVNSFKGQTLKREFDYADKLKPSENDTVYTALGKLQTLKVLKQISWEKNILIKNLMQRDKLSLADAVEIADKKIDIKAVDKAVKEYTQPLYTLRNPKTKQTIMVPKKRAIELGVANV